jgi:hypothetical protein
MSKPEIPKILSGADEVVVVKIPSEMEEERRASQERFLLYNNLMKIEDDF